MNHQQIVSGLQSRISTTSQRISDLELWCSAYEYLQRSKACKEAKAELKQLRSEQAVSKRALGVVIGKVRNG